MAVKLSIVIPAYNAEKTIEECIKSVICCTSKEIEVIIVNDGSTDRTQELCEKLASNDERIKCICKENSGVSGARNVGIRNARGRYIGFVDSDDKVSDVLIDKVLSIINEKEVESIIFGYKGFNKGSYVGDRECFEEGIYNYNNGLDFFDYLVKNSRDPIRHVWSCIYRTEILRKNAISFMEGMTWGEDFDFNLRYFSSINTIYSINQALYLYEYPENTLKKETKRKHIKSQLYFAGDWANILIEKNACPYLLSYMSEWFCNAVSLIGYLDKSDKGELLLLVRNNRHLFKYVSCPKYRVAVVIWKMFGVNIGNSIIKTLREKKIRKDEK